MAKSAIFHHEDNKIIHILTTDDSGGKKIIELSLDKGRALIFLALILLFEEQLNCGGGLRNRLVRRKRKLISREYMF